MIRSSTPPHVLSEQGFTLIELMLAMLIFAMLALSGWQIMDSITKSRDRANLQVKALSQLDYAYLQLSQDFAQTVNYVVMPADTAKVNNPFTAANLTITPTFLLQPQQVSFMRFADPDPRYQQSPVLAKVTYNIVGDKLIKQRFYTLNDSNESPVTSEILSGIQHASWVALTPQMVDNFPDEATLQKVQQLQAKKAARQSASAQSSDSNAQNSSQNTDQNNAGQHANNQNDNNQMGSEQKNSNLASGSALTDRLPYQQLPRGVELNFNYQGEKITWRFAIPSPPPTSSI